MVLSVKDNSLENRLLVKSTVITTNLYFDTLDKTTNFQKFVSHSNLSCFNHFISFVKRKSLRFEIVLPLIFEFWMFTCKSKVRIRKSTI